ncbi:jg7867 [Pararge aegeria aegeria]|uniref:Jg7867 protein n=1 Tax=Pararge aegeria aegeria TaxID=348720 RepID=A0A8S4S641_9NEOP|nr:jg7867 [Pararge aegeria aegeria]
MRRTLDGWDCGVRIGGVKLTNLRYADDTTLLAASETEMTSLLDRMEQISNAMGLFINRSKTRAMVVDRVGRLELTGSLNLEIVENFIYLGSNISATGSCETEIRRRIAKSAMSQLHRTWKYRNISIKTKSASGPRTYFSYIYVCS